MAVNALSFPEVLVTSPVVAACISRIAKHAPTSVQAFQQGMDALCLLVGGFEDVGALDDVTLLDFTLTDAARRRFLAQLAEIWREERAPGADCVFPLVHSVHQRALAQLKISAADLVMRNARAIGATSKALALATVLDDDGAARFRLKKGSSVWGTVLL